MMPAVSRCQLRPPEFTFTARARLETPPSALQHGLGPVRGHARIVAAFQKLISRPPTPAFEVDPPTDAPSLK
jgi:hypothetical protein